MAKARILAKSVKVYCPNAKFTLILADQIPDTFKLEEEPFDKILTINELGMPVDNLNLWIFIHTVVELCTAIKGQALVKLLQEGEDKVVYLDPDIAVFHNMSFIETLLNEYDVILTPHQTIPETGQRDIVNNEICSLKHGTYNFGFYAVRNSKNGNQFAEWWRDRLLHFCYDDIPNGLFTDQKWGDLAPAMFEGVYVLRDPGYNVSTWNITTRNVIKDSNNNYLVNGQKLIFYHFSGFDSGAQEVMLAQNGKNNIYLQELRDWYIKRQYEEGQEEMQALSSIFNFYDNGESVSNEQRLTLRNRMDLLEYFGKSNPFSVDQERSYYHWFKNEEKILKDKEEQKKVKAQQKLNAILEKNKALEEQNALLVESLEEYKQINVKMRKSYEDTKYQLDEILSSQSWKITKGFRMLKNRILGR